VIGGKLVCGFHLRFVARAHIADHGELHRAGLIRQRELLRGRHRRKTARQQDSRWDR